MGGLSNILLGRPVSDELLAGNYSHSCPSAHPSTSFHERALCQRGEDFRFVTSQCGPFWSNPHSCFLACRNAVDQIKGVTFTSIRHSLTQRTLGNLRIESQCCRGRCGKNSLNEANKTDLCTLLRCPRECIFSPVVSVYEKPFIAQHCFTNFFQRTSLPPRTAALYLSVSRTFALAFPVEGKSQGASYFFTSSKLWLLSFTTNFLTKVASQNTSSEQKFASSRFCFISFSSYATLSSSGTTFI